MAIGCLVINPSVPSLDQSVLKASSQVGESRITRELPNIKSLTNAKGTMNMGSTINDHDEDQHNGETLLDNDKGANNHKTIITVDDGSSNNSSEPTNNEQPIPETKIRHTSAWTNPQNLATWIDNEVNSFLSHLEAQRQLLLKEKQLKHSSKRKWLSSSITTRARNLTGAHSN